MSIPSAVLDAFPSSEVASDVKEVTLTSLCTQSTFGLAWNLTSDKLSLKYQLSERPFTKRGLLSSIGLIYDPLGIICPVILAGRLLQRAILEEVRDSNEISSWDDVLTDKGQSSLDNW